MADETQAGLVACSHASRGYCDCPPPIPEPEVGTILLATPDGRVWVRTPHAWNSNQGWFGWSWKHLLGTYGLHHLMHCTVGPSLAEVCRPDAEGASR